MYVLYVYVFPCFVLANVFVHAGYHREPKLLQVRIMLARIPQSSLEAAGSVSEGPCGPDLPTAVARMPGV